MCVCYVCYVKFVCVKLLSVKFVYVKFVCSVCGGGAGGGGGEGGARDTESKTRTPHKDVGKKKVWGTPFWRHSHMGNLW